MFGYPARVDDLLAADHPAVRRVVPPQRVWVDLAVVLAGKRPTGTWSQPAMSLQPSPGLLLGWVRTLGHGWAAIVEVVVRLEGQDVSTRMLAPSAAITPDSPALRRKMGGKTSNRPTLAQQVQRQEQR